MGNEYRKGNCYWLDSGTRKINKIDDIMARKNRESKIKNNKIRIEK